MRVSISIRDKDQEAIDAFKELEIIAVKEDISVSKIIRTLVKTYIKEHKDGNRQRT